jgi:hypothetical protein
MRYNANAEKSEVRRRPGYRGQVTGNRRQEAEGGGEAGKRRRGGLGK